MTLFNPSSLAAAFALSVLSALPVLAEQAPGAGLIYKQSQTPELLPLKPSVELDLQGASLPSSQNGGAKISLNSVNLQGHSVFSTEELQTVLGDVKKQQYDLAGLRQLANQISLFYREQGYPFATAVLPAQSMDDGVLVIQILEGQYGRVYASGNEPFVSATTPYLSKLQPGRTIESHSIERSTLILGDVPGIEILPVMRPGDALGSGDLDVRVSEGQRVAGRVAVDNHGSRFSGEYRSRADIQANRLLMVGDELSVTALYSNEDTWLGGVNYSLPLAANGLRGFVDYSHTDYSLGKGFEGYTGTAKVSALGVSYPLIRSQQSNLRLQASYQHKDLDDDIDFVSYSKGTRSDSLPLSVFFDHRDAWAGGGISWGALTVTPGKIKLQQQNVNSTNYDFVKINLDVSRLQYLTDKLSLFSRVSGQWSNRENLDGSESFYLGGPVGVRAYALGEGSDSRGLLGQIELRYSAGMGLSPYVLLDGGRTSNGGVNQGDDRSVSGAGVGVRYNHAGWSADLVSAWSVSGGKSQADEKKRTPRVWFNVGYVF